jgi:hypothetical protein
MNFSTSLEQSLPQHLPIVDLGDILCNCTTPMKGTKQTTTRTKRTLITPKNIGVKGSKHMFSCQSLKL